MSKTNAWITLENTRAMAWWDWYQWAQDARTNPNPGPEPELDNWAKNALRKMGDVTFNYQKFRKATIQQREWRMFAIWDITKEQADSGYEQYGDAEEGGDYAVSGFWEWNEGDIESALMPYYNWRPNALLKYMPLNPDGSEPTEVTDVFLQAGQPPKELPKDPITIEP